MCTYIFGWLIIVITVIKILNIQMLKYKTKNIKNLFV